MRFHATALFSLFSLTQASPTVSPHVSTRNPSGVPMQLGTYYVNWAIYGRKHFVTDLPADQLTKINYAFANVNNVTGEVFLSDLWADIQFPYPGDVAAPANRTEVLGNFKQLYLLKQKFRNVKVILSIGGWTYSPNFAPGLATVAGQKKFCTSSLTLIADLGLDGIDIDWEYPQNAAEAADLLNTVKICRKTFDKYSAQYANGYHFDIGVAAAAGPQNYVNLGVKELDPYIDNWNVMAFDYQGAGFSNFTGHLSNVFPSLDNPKATNGWVPKENRFVPFNSKEAIDYYKANTADSRKIQLGLPMYGRQFSNVVDLSKQKRGLGQKFNGSGPGSWEAGVYDMKVLPMNGSKVYSDEKTIASWSWDKVEKSFISFDTPKVARWKADWLLQEGCGGAWVWESSGDYPVSNSKSIRRTVLDAFGGKKNLQIDRNNLYYPKSKYDNIRNATIPRGASY